MYKYKHFPTRCWLPYLLPVRKIDGKVHHKGANLVFAISRETCRKFGRISNVCQVWRHRNKTSSLIQTSFWPADLKNIYFWSSVSWAKNKSYGYSRAQFPFQKSNGGNKIKPRLLRSWSSEVSNVSVVVLKMLNTSSSDDIFDKQEDNDGIN